MRFTIPFIWIISVIYLPSPLLFSTYSTLLCTCRVLVGKHECKTSLGRHKHRWENNIKMNFQEVIWSGLDWIDLDEDRDRWWALVNAVMNLQVPYLREISWLAADLLASEEGLCSVGLVCSFCKHNVRLAHMQQRCHWSHIYCGGPRPPSKIFSSYIN